MPQAQADLANDDRSGGGNEEPIQLRDLFKPFPLSCPPVPRAPIPCGRPPRRNVSLKRIASSLSVMFRLVGAAAAPHVTYWLPSMLAAGTFPGSFFSTRDLLEVFHCVLNTSNTPELAVSPVLRAQSQIMTRRSP